MSVLTFRARAARGCVGLKGPKAAEWLAARGIAAPAAPNTWTVSGERGAGGTLLVARLGASEFFLDAAGTAGGNAAARLVSALQTPAAGVYPVLREDAAFELAGEGAADVLAQICNVNFAAQDARAQAVIMTLMIGVAVLIVAQNADGGVQYRIWCDPTFGPYLDEAVGTVVMDCGGSHGEMSA